MLLESFSQTIMKLLEIPLALEMYYFISQSSLR